MLFETDGKGDDAKVTAWRIGVPSQVDYVEGCSWRRRPELNRVPLILAR